MKLSPTWKWQPLVARVRRAGAHRSARAVPVADAVCSQWVAASGLPQGRANGQNVRARARRAGQNVHPWRLPRTVGSV
ncbi:hypothetical protein [Cupriavidus oxalaticus]|uniref:hypothetical protein n=1 Tax=Cupriavidus oxalaticus TaxID=96344 RepID=UPI003F731ADA